MSVTVTKHMDFQLHLPLAFQLGPLSLLLSPAGVEAELLHTAESHPLEASELWKGAALVCLKVEKAGTFTTGCLNKCQDCGIWEGA